MDKDNVPESTESSLDVGKLVLAIECQHCLVTMSLRDIRTRGRHGRSCVTCGHHIKNIAELEEKIENSS